MRVVRKSEYQSMPWKNGGGETLEVAIHPPEASVNNFDWRVSVAKVAADGLFSMFPDIDRTLTLLEGEGLELATEAGSARTLQRGGEPFSFPADLPTEARLLKGPITDLNVMSRRGRYTHRVQRRVIDDTASIQACAGTTLIIGNSPWVLLQPKAEMQPLDLLMLNGGEAQLRPHDRYAVLFIVEIMPDANDSHASQFRSPMTLSNNAPDFDRGRHRAAV